MLNPRLRRRLLRHHLPLLFLSAAASVVLFVTRPYRDSISQASFATAYPALVLLALTLLLGAMRVLSAQRVPISYDLRRDIGIWAGILSMTHAVLGQFVHLRGRPWLYYVYPFSAHKRFPLRHDLFGIENDAGLLSALIVLLLLATSSDLMLRRLGTQRWKRLQRWSYAAFALAGIHTICYEWNESAARGLHVLSFAALVAATVVQAAGYLSRRHQKDALS